MRSWPIEDLREGMTASYSQTITDYDVKAFAGISGDHNPIHIDDEYAAKSRFKRRIAHGFHSASFFSAIFGTQLPGKGCVYASQSLNFKRPVYLGDTVTASVTVIGIDLQSKKVDFETVCKVRNKVVTSGTAQIFLPEG